MSAFYGGQYMGFAQQNYYDQQSTAIEGQLAFASDINLVDAATVVMPADKKGQFMPVGRGVTSAYSPNGSRPGMTSMVISPVNANTQASGFYGIVICNQQTQTSPDGLNGWYDGRVANVLRKDRVGGRVWVRAWKEATENTPVYLIIKNSSNHGFPIGGFSGSEIAGAEIPASAGFLTGTTLTLPGLSSITNGGFDITVDSTLVKVSGLDFSSATNITQVAELVAAKITTATVTAVNGALVITSKTTGASSTVTVASAPTTEETTDVSERLGLSASAGAQATAGAAASTTPDTIQLDTVIWRTPAKSGELGMVELI